VALSPAVILEDFAELICVRMNRVNEIGWEGVAHLDICAGCVAPIGYASVVPLGALRSHAVRVSLARSLAVLAKHHPNVGDCFEYDGPETTQRDGSCEKNLDPCQNCSPFAPAM
jgi:hypothetical protein